MSQTLIPVAVGVADRKDGHIFHVRREMAEGMHVSNRGDIWAVVKAREQDTGFHEVSRGEEHD